MPARMTWLSSTSAPRAAGGTAPRSAGPFRVPSWVIAPLPGVRTARYPPVAGQRPPLPQPSAPAPAVRRASGRDNTGRVEPEPAPLAEYFDHWYADMSVSPVKDEIQQRHLGLPPHLLSSSLLGWEGIAEAVRQATEHARQRGSAAEFRVGDLAATGLDAGSASGVLCVDAIQFAPRPEAAYREIRRILAPGGRAVLTCWEPREPGDERLPARLRQVGPGAGLTAAGFTDVEVFDRPGWRDRERAMWAEAAALDPGEDQALISFHNEALRAPLVLELTRRVMATATAP